MNQILNTVHISNFKSIRSCTLSNLNRINIFIGKPNVGKSNIIEALSLYSIPFLVESIPRKLTSLVRLENELELFHNGNNQLAIEVSSDIGICSLHYNREQGLYGELNLIEDFYRIQIDDKLKVKGLKLLNNQQPQVKLYNFQTNIKFKKSHAKYLIPPYGSNLLSVIEAHPNLKKNVMELFKENNLEIVFDKASQTIKILKKVGSDIFLIPYNSIADTLQRLIFFQSAILSNSGSVLLFEEPEAHSFPPYITHITQEIIYNKENQYFIATHSPFLLNDLIEHAMNEISVFAVTSSHGETKIKQLLPEELREVMQYGVDLFTNIESYI